MEVVISKEFRILFVADAIVHEDQLIPFLYQQATHGPGAEIVLVGWMNLIPQGLGHYAEHGAAIQLKKTCFNKIELHTNEFIPGRQIDYAASPGRNIARSGQ